ncbi:hypothetical protein AMECASPLE_019817 [Ameca splendens]|uniref:Uncharacterized protein n=1 Tax=Ameca splendens TaxID=208324 RepID=A0ABV0YQ00_9TELE
MVVIGFMENEVTVQGMLNKVQHALGNYVSLILTDAQGNEILDSEGTRGIHKSVHAKTRKLNSQVRHTASKVSK